MNQGLDILEKKLLRKFFGRFIKAGIIKISTDDFQNPVNQLQNNILAVGILTRSYIAENDKDIPPVDLAKFFQ